MALADAVPFAVAHWSLDEASGTRVDDVGSNDLADNNTVGVTTGVFGNAADFESANSEYLSIADNVDVTGADEDILLRILVNMESKAANGQVMGQWFITGNQRSYRIVYAAGGTDRFLFQSSGDGSAATTVVASNLGSPVLGTTYLIHAWHDAVNNQIGIAVNGGTANTASHATGLHNSTGAFTLGAIGGGNTDFFDGWMDDAVLLRGYILDATERSEDYNSGSFRAFADWAGVGEFPFRRYYQMSGAL